MSADRNEVERTEAPSPRWAALVRERGPLPSSQDLVTACTILSGLLMLTCAGPLLTNGFSAQFSTSLEEASKLTDTLDLPRSRSWLATNLVQALPFLLVPAIVCAFVGLAQAGGRFRSENLCPSLQRFGSGHVLHRLMDGSSAKASAFAAIRLVVLVLFAAVWLTSEIRQANGTELVQSSAAVESYLSIPLRVATRLAIVSVAFGIVQYIAAWMRYLGQLRLTRAELAAEIRESEGDPVNRRRVRQHQLNRSHVRWEKLLRSGDLVLVGNGRRAVAVRVGADGRTVLIGKAIGTVSSLMERAAVVRGAAIVRNNALVTIAAMHGKVGGELPAQLVDSIARIRRDRSLDCVLGA